MGHHYVYTALLVVSLLSQQSSSAPRVVNVIKYGAKANGGKDNTLAFMKAWSYACASSGPTTVFRVPKGRFVVGSLSFSGPCNSSNLIVRIAGTLVAPSNYRILAKSDNWLSFDGLTGVSIIGGSLDAGGASLWACKAASHHTCSDGATSLSITGSSRIVVKNLLSLNSQMYHIVINGCQDVRVEGVRVVASEQSPNTDGIHVQQSRNVAIIDSSIKTGDDCISIGPGAKDLWIEGVSCGPGHGISIGSLGKYPDEQGVKNVTIKKSVFRGSQNGLRIKAWARASKGFVQRVRFLGATMQNVKYPIVIDQYYCPNNACPKSGESGVRISDVLYQGIRGTSATQVAVKLACSAKNPCRRITLQNVNLTYAQGGAQSLCSYANGKTLGFVHPKNCL